MKKHSNGDASDQTVKPSKCTFDLINLGFNSGSALDFMGVPSVSSSEVGTSDSQAVQIKRAVVNAANYKLIGKSGFAKALQDKGGRELLKELKQLSKKGCKVTENILTDAHDINGFDHIIHAVGPNFGARKGFVDTTLWKGASYGYPKQAATAQDVLNETYYNIIQTAVKNSINEVSCPIISGAKFKGKVFKNADIAEMTIKAIVYADTMLSAANINVKNKINFVFCTFGEEYFKHLESYDAKESKNISCKVVQVKDGASTSEKSADDLMKGLVNLNPGRVRG